MPSKRLSVVTFNLHKGMSPFNRRSHMQEIASALQQLSADVLFLQEVQGRHAGREQHQPGWPQHDFLAAALTHSASYGMNVRYDHGHHGNAVLSRFPQQLAANHDISVNRLERRGILQGPAEGLSPELQARIVRGQILAGEPRIDGRDTRTVRPIEIRTGVLPRTHGSALFTRGETQALVIATLGTGRDEQIIDAIAGETPINRATSVVVLPSATHSRASR